MATQGWVKLHRSMLEHWSIQDPIASWLWSYLLMRASHKPIKWIYRGHLYSLERGQAIVSIRDVAKLGKVSKKTITSRLKLFESESQVVTKRDHRGTIITICNYNIYQAFDNEESSTEVPQKFQQGDTEVPAGVPINKNKNEKNEKNLSINGIPSPELTEGKKQLGNSPVFMTASEIEKLIDTVRTPEEAKYWIARLSDYARDYPKKFSKYKNHYRTVLDWRRREMSKARQFYNHPTTGWNYYPNYEIERLERGKV